MSAERRRAKKKKARERDAKKKVLARREVSRAKRREEREIEKLEEARRERIEPIVDPLKLIDRDISIAENDIKEAKAMNSSENVIKALERNLEILKNMKEEYLAEQEQKVTLNEELEKAGCKTLKEKVDYLTQQAQQLDENQAGNVGGVAEVKFNPNPPKRKKPLHERAETASCEVVKAAERDLEENE